MERPEDRAANWEAVMWFAMGLAVGVASLALGIPLLVWLVDK